MLPESRPQSLMRSLTRACTASRAVADAGHELKLLLLRLTLELGPKLAMKGSLVPGSESWACCQNHAPSP